jgi:hypothetical protein
MKSHQGESKSKSQIVLILGLTWAIVGYFGPWVDHKTAALVLTGQDMGEFVKFLPEVRAGAVPMIREFFYLPPFAAALCLILLMANKRLAYPLVVRTVMLLAVLGLAWAMLPMGAAPPLWQVLAAREAVNQAYGWPVQVGWGLWVTVVGFLIVMAGAVPLFGTDGH